MSRKFKLSIFIALALLVVIPTVAFAHSQDGPLPQTGMDTPMPEAATPQITPTPTWDYGNNGNMGSGVMGSGSMMAGSAMNTSGTPMAGGMDMSGCPMMSGMTSSTGMSSTGMTGMNMADLDAANINGLADPEAYSVAAMIQNPWLLLGWVLLALLGIAIITGIVLGIVWLARRSGSKHTSVAS